MIVVAYHPEQQASPLKWFHQNTHRTLYECHQVPRLQPLGYATFQLDESRCASGLTSPVCAHGCTFVSRSCVPYIFTGKWKAYSLKSLKYS